MSVVEISQSHSDVEFLDMPVPRVQSRFSSRPVEVTRLQHMSCGYSEFEQHMNIQGIVSKAFQTQTLTAQQEHDIATLIRRNHCSEADLAALDRLTHAIRSSSVRYARP